MALSSQESGSKDCTLVALNDDNREALPGRLGLLRPFMHRVPVGFPSVNSGNGATNEDSDRRMERLHVKYSR